MLTCKAQLIDPSWRHSLELFSLKYNGDLPATDTPAWMTSDFDVWFEILDFGPEPYLQP